MNSALQYRLAAGDLEFVLALSRAGTLAETAIRLGVDSSTVFRSLQRMEKGLGQRLFERSRRGYHPTELAHRLTQHAERLEHELEAARALAQFVPGEASGTVRLATTDTLLHALLLPVLAPLAREHPKLRLELMTSNEKVCLTKREADIALRATNDPPEHLIGKKIGSMKVALFAPASAPASELAEVLADGRPWLALDDAIPQHPTVLWRRRHCPDVVPHYSVNSVLAVVEGIAAGLGVGLVPQRLVRGRHDIVQVGDPLEGAESQLWLLAHPESRHLRRISAVYGFLAERLSPLD